MSVLQQALEKLNGSLYNLETSVNGLEAAKTGEQRDMFGHIIPKDGSANQNAQINAAVVAKQLDIAIEKVEQVLSEAAG